MQQDVIHEVILTFFPVNLFDNEGSVASVCVNFSERNTAIMRTGSCKGGAAFLDVSLSEGGAGCRGVK